ncbi:hypothetical protein DFH07DRAFT_778042 [Mycena maculata]|uniref:Uncharacterized protein n=1 Tax=Mycena maculata TaxID=230809 RepID=A0AAD7IEX5_9AGAR|nr:hypothetical protein DFH07DRAFT_778042 [Mycena maculata]
MESRSGLARSRCLWREQELANQSTAFPIPLTSTSPVRYPEARHHLLIPHSDNWHFPDFTVDDVTGDDDSDTESNLSLPDELRVEDIETPILRYYDNIEKEHGVQTTISPVARIPWYEPLPQNAASTMNVRGSTSSKRRKVEDELPLARQIMCAETFKAMVQTWEPRFPDLRGLRGDIFFTIQRFIEVIEWLELRAEFRQIFFPFDEAFEIIMVWQMFALEHEHNRDGFFRRNPYHLNALLHDAECNFLQACAILFRETKDFKLAFTIEELLGTRFRDDTSIIQLLRGGFLDSTHEFADGYYNHSHGTLEEVEMDYPVLPARAL